MSSTNNFGQSATRQLPMAVESFRPSSISLSTPEETFLKKPKRQFKKIPDHIATSLSPTGFAVSASVRDVYIYNVKDSSKCREIPWQSILSLELQSNKEEIRAVALSEDLLAVLTHYRLLVYDQYTTSTDLTRNLVREIRLNQEANWTSWSVSIAQISTSSQSEGAFASIIVGGVGVNGVKLFKFAYMSGWNLLEQRFILKCPDNNGAVKVVGFSPDRTNPLIETVAFALTIGNHLYCWRVSEGPNRRLQSVYPSWHINCNPINNQRSYSDEISSAAMIICPKGNPYILCTVNHRKRSFLLHTFIVAVDFTEKRPLVLRSKMKSLPENVVGTNVLVGIASPNGHFVIIVEDRSPKNMKLLTLQGANGGGLTCSARFSDWKLKTEAVNMLSPAISMFVQEQLGALEITVVDGRGNISCTRVGVPDMPVSQPSLLLSPRETVELPLNESTSVRLSQGSSVLSTSTTATGQISGRDSLGPG